MTWYSRVVLILLKPVSRAKMLLLKSWTTSKSRPVFSLTSKSSSFSYWICTRLKTPRAVAATAIPKAIPPRISHHRQTKTMLSIFSAIRGWEEVPRKFHRRLQIKSDDRSDLGVQLLPAFMIVGPKDLTAFRVWVMLTLASSIEN
jgi:hypothetical protein